MSVLAPYLFQQFLNQTGTAPAVGGKLFSYVAGTSTKQATYTDSSGSIQNTNPMILDSTGSVPYLWLDPALVYKFVLAPANDTDPPASPYRSEDNVYPFFNASTPSTIIGSILYPLTTAEIGVGFNLSNTNLAYPYENAARYKADPTGGVDATTILNAALTLGSLYLPKGTYKLSASLTPISGSTLYGDGSTTVLQFALGSVTNISLVSVSYVTVRDLKVSVAGTGAGGLEPAIVYMYNATHCTVERVEGSGSWFAGIWLDGASHYNRIVGNSFHDFNEPNGAFGDITIQALHGGGTVAPSYNVIDGNQCFGGGGWGVAVYDPYAAALNGFPVKNVVTNNRIGPHITYGIMMYMPGSSAGPADTWNTFSNNYIEGISGTNPTNNASGTGIYLVGNGIGAAVISGNTIVNCCTGTVTRSLAPAGIGISNVGTGITPPTVVGNIVTNMTQGDGILVTSSVGGATVIGNSVNMPSTNNGTGPGGGSLQGAAFRAEASSDVTFSDNQARCYGTSAGIYVYANGVNANHITIDSCNIQTAGAGNALQAAQNGGFNVNYLSVSNSYFVASNGTPDAVTLNAIIVGTFANNRVNATTSRALFVNGCTQMRFSGGEYQTTGTVAIGTSGACTSSFIDKTVWFGGVSSLVSNAGTGLNIEWRVTSNTVPTTGTWAIGDIAFPAAVAIGSPKSWHTTTAGTPGTQTSSGNL